MLEHNAMRYLLARQLWALRQAVTADVYEEVTATLAVSREGEMYAVAWTRGGESFSRMLPRTDYNFYRKGDRADSEGVVETFEKENVARARALAADILGADPAAFDRSGRLSVLRYGDYASFAWMVALCAGVSVAAPSSATLCAVLFAVFAVEYAPRFGRLFAACALLAFPLLAWPFTGAFAGVFFAAAHFLDPNRALRTARAAVSVAAFALSVVLFSGEWPSLTDAAIAAAVFAAMAAVTVFRWTLGSHFRITPLFLPMASAAMILDGAHIAGLAFAASSAVSLTAGMYVWRLLPHPPGATHQGVSGTTWQ